jgi:S-adenosylmethionine-diacylgycerolhomoserine-N-methlytransferase
MVNPGWENLAAAAIADLRPGGILAVADFHDTPIPAFRRWMAFNHVRMEGQILPFLEKAMPNSKSTVSNAYLGAWRHFSFTGVKA